MKKGVTSAIQKCKYSLNLLHLATKLLEFLLSSQETDKSLCYLNLCEIRSSHSITNICFNTLQR